MAETPIYFQRIYSRWILHDQSVVTDGCVIVGKSKFCEPQIVAVEDPASNPALTIPDILSLWSQLSPAVSAVPQREACFLPDFDLGDQVLLPGLINCHSHLEFSSLNEPLPISDGTFASWIRAVILSRPRPLTAAEQAEQLAAKAFACRNGWREMHHSGTSAVGEILSRPSSSDFYTTGSDTKNPPFEGVIFHEVLGLSQERAQEAWRQLQANLLAFQQLGVSNGVSPHAPYSTSTWLYQQCVDYSVAYNMPLATHLAESCEETQLLTERSGPLVELFRDLEVWAPDAITTWSYRDILERLVQVPKLLLIHANYLKADDWQWINNKNPNTTVVYCPQTHAYFDHPHHPWPQMVADGLNVALGTDSRASSRSLSLWDDVLLVRQRYPEQDAKFIWQMATINGARALGFADRLGTITPGKLARFSLAQFANSSDQFSWEGLLSSTTKLSSYEPEVGPAILVDR